MPAARWTAVTDSAYVWEADAIGLPAIPDEPTRTMTFAESVAEAPLGRAAQRRAGPSSEKAAAIVVLPIRVRVSADTQAHEA